MSSISSSDFENSELDFNNVTPWPMQPLVYYTSRGENIKSNPCCGNEKCRDRRHNPNCFVKAFRWYTQERYPKKTDSMSTNSPEIKGFAMWLDEKYHEFIQDGGRSNNTLKTSLEIAAKSNFPCESCGTKKCKRPKSLRKRHGKLTNSNGNALRSNKSFEILLHPKQTMSRTASERYQRGYSCCTYCPMSPNPRRKSQSLTSVMLEREVYQIPYDAIDDKEAKRIIDSILDPNHNETTKCQTKKNISCQCVNEDVKLDVSCQCSSRAKVGEIAKPARPMKKNNRQNAGTDLLQPIQPLQAGNLSSITNGTQTCDIPIQLPTQYPLFMRIICPDKL